MLRHFSIVQQRRVTPMSLKKEQRPSSLQQVQKQHSERSLQQAFV
jgi:hypothetical protein